MKKLIAIISVLAAGFVGTAKADITMSAGSSLEMQSIGSSSNLSIGGSLGFAFSQDLGNGVTVTMSGLSFGNDVAVADNISTNSAGAITTSTTRVTQANIDGSVIRTGGVDARSTNNTFAFTNVDAITTATITADTSAIDTDAFEQISFATANGTLTYGSDVEIDYADLGVGDVLSSDLTDTGLGTATSAMSLGNTTGNGIQYATSFGGSSLTLGYLMKNTAGVDLFDTSASGNSNTMSVKTAVPVGPLSATIAYTTDNTANATNNTFGVSTSMAAGSGTISVAYVSSDATTDTTQMSAKYATTVGAASVAIGYSSTDASGSTNTNNLTASISQSIGTGASIFAEFANRDGVASGGETSAVLLGSSFAF
jgi:hypothetical protein